MGDKFNSGGGDEQVAKDQSTFVNINDQGTSVDQNIVGNGNILAGQNVTINGDVNNTTKYYYAVPEKVSQPKKDFSSTSYEVEIISLTICKESYLFKSKLKVIWQFQGVNNGPPITYSVDKKKIEKYSIEVTEALDDYIKNINSGLRKIKFRNLAREGYKLFNCLIPETPECPECYPVKEIIKKGERNVKMVIESDIDVPWNSIYIDGDFNNVESYYFFGNRYKLSVHIPFFSKEIFCKSSRYAARDHNQLKEIKALIAQKFEKTIHLIDEKTSKNNYNDSRIGIMECKSLGDFCDKITGNKQHKNAIPPNLLFICFDKYSFSFLSRDPIIYIGNLKLSISGLKRELSEIDGHPPFVIIIGKKTTCSAYIQLRNLFIHELRWNGIVIDGNVDLNLADNYLLDFFAKFTDENNSVPEVLFKLREKHKIGLAFTAYCNDHVCFKEYS